MSSNLPGHISQRHFLTQIKDILFNNIGQFLPTNDPLSCGLPCTDHFL